LDKHDIVDAKKEDEKMRKVCALENAEFERQCIASWVSYFKDRRLGEFKKAALLAQQEASFTDKKA